MMYLWSTNPQRLGSRLIRLWGQDRCSHFAKYYPTQGLIVESRAEYGVREVSYEEWLADGNQLIYSIVMPFTWDDTSLLLADKTLIGKRYDRKGVVFLAVTTFIRWLWKAITFRENRWGAREEYFCVEIVKTHEEALRALSVNVDVDWENMYPEELYEYLTEELSSSNED